MKRTLLTILILSVGVLLVTALTVHIRDVPKLSTIKKTFRSENLTILDRGGRVIDEIRKPDQIRRLNWVGLSEVPQSFIDAVLKSERWRFSKDSITMQLAQGRLWPSIALEMVWSKKQILEAYINLSVYRDELQGVAAASQALFDRPPAKLTRAQGAILASLMHSKNMSVDRARGKACALLQSLDAGHECGLLSPSHLAYVERGYRLRPFVKMAPHVAQLLGDLPELREENVVRSTLDRDVQWTALHALQKQNVADGAVVVIENATGNVLAYVGNPGLSPDESYRDLAMDLRQGGTGLKPFLFAKAVDERTLTSAAVPDGKDATLTLTRALREPLKLPALTALELVGSDDFARTLASLGFRRLERAEFYGPSLALGAADVRLLDLTNAYRALANKGVWTAPRFSLNSTSESAARRIYSTATAFIISENLRDAANPAIWSALLCDDWCVGYSEKYTVGVLGGGETVWREVMSSLHKTESSQAPQPPPGVRAVDGEWFLEGTEPSVDGPLQSRISFPQNGSLIELDAKKPKESSRIFIQVAAPRADQNVYLNGRRLGRAQPLLPWKPENGHYQLELRDAKGRSLHKVRFEVRGLSFAGG